MILHKPYTNSEYAELASYCNNHNSIIVDKGDYLESEPITVSEDAYKESLIGEYQSYLNFTDWYVTRQSEIGVAIPEDVVAKRANARVMISSLRNNNVEPTSSEEVINDGVWEGQETEIADEPTTSEADNQLSLELTN